MSSQPRRALINLQYQHRRAGHLLRAGHGCQGPRGHLGAYIQHFGLEVINHPILQIENPRSETTGSWPTASECESKPANLGMSGSGIHTLYPWEDQGREQGSNPASSGY